jgi:very-short-patch-repair endonuclease
VDADRIVADIASAQHSVVTRRQLLERGVSQRAIEHRLANGSLVRMHAGVYRPEGHLRSWHQTLMAAALAAGPEAAVSHRGAAFLHGITDITPCAEVTVRATRAPRTGDVLIHRAAQLDRVDIGAVDRIPTTRPARTLIDLAGVLGPSALEAAVDDFLSRRLVSVEYLGRRLDALGRAGRGGAGVLADQLADRSGARPRTHSEFERRLLAALRRGGLPVPRTQFEVELPGGRKAFLDAAYPEQLLGIEADSYRHHSSRSDWGRDRTRNRMLTAIGWRILPVTWNDLVPDPAAMLDLIARGLNRIPRCAG